MDENESDILDGHPAPEEVLVALAERHFGVDELSEVDRRFFGCVVRGEICRPEGKKLDVETLGDMEKLENDDDWEGYILRADRIAWLCGNTHSKELVPSFGIHLIGFRVEDDLECANIRVDFPLWLEESAMTGDIRLEYSKVESLSLEGSRCNGINADRLDSSSSLSLSDEFEAIGTVTLTGSTIGGQLNCSGGHFLCETGDALNANAMKIEADVFLRDGFKAEGRVSLVRATIGGQLDCDGGHFLCKEGDALDANAMTVKESVFFRTGFKAEGRVNLGGVTIGGQLACDGGHFLCDEGDYAFNANEISVGSSVFIGTGFKAKGKVDLGGSTIGGQLACGGGHFMCKTGAALTCEAMTVKAYVYLGLGFKAEGGVNLSGATIDGVLFIHGIELHEKTTFDLSLATIGTLFDKEESWPKKKGNLDLHGFTYGSIHKESETVAKKRIKWLNLQGNGAFDPQPYEQLASVLKKMGHGEDATDINIEKERERARFYKKDGPNPSGIEKSRREEIKDELFWKWRCRWDRFYGAMVYFGFRPFRRTLPLLLIVFLLGWFTYEVSFHSGIMAPTRKPSDIDVLHAQSWNKDELYPVFQPFVYSADALIPIIDFGQTDYWQPNPYVGDGWGNVGLWHFSAGGVVLFFMYFQIVAGWVLTTFIVAGIAGLVRQEDG